mgnify:FL=1
MRYFNLYLPSSVLPLGEEIEVSLPVIKEDLRKYVWIILNSLKEFFNFFRNIF